VIRFKETLIRQASDVIRWMDATGRVGQESPVLNPLQIALADDIEVKQLSILHKPGASIIWRADIPGAVNLQRSIDIGRPTDADKQRPTEPVYELKGTVVDPTGIFNPRAFAKKNCGNNSFPHIALYRSLLGTRLSQNKSLQGILHYQKQADETSSQPAGWALVSLRVTLGTTGDSFDFNAQADANGYFQLPVTRLSLTMLTAGFSAVFSVKANKAQSAQAFPDPDQMTDMQIAIEDGLVFTDTLDVFAEQTQYQLKLAFVANETRVTTLTLKSP
jgi:hypothetical protein